MLEEILLLERLVALDSEADAARATQRAQARAVTQAEQQLVALGERIAGLEAARAAARAAEAEVQVELDKYVARRDRTRKQLDAGAIPDFLAAEKQLQNYLEIIDGLETDLLERMEAREELDEQLIGQNALRHRVEHVRDKRIAQRDEEGAALDARLAELAAERPERLEALPVFLRRDYDNERKTHLDAWAWLNEDGACTACQVVHPAQLKSEVRRQARLHRCRGCHRFLLGPAEGPDDADGEAPAGEG
ncbi:MAG: hypothetical protein H6742_10835 [Alphaproteobacteria bacterium]|nr:hypothetical protein [Alphaproteobacteria bacterium]